ERAVGARGAGRLPHPVAEHLAAAELRLLPRSGQIPLDEDEQLRVGQPNPVAHGRPVELRVLPPAKTEGHRTTLLSRLSPAVRAPALPAPFPGGRFGRGAEPPAEAAPHTAVG